MTISWFMVARGIRGLSFLGLLALIVHNESVTTLSFIMDLLPILVVDEVQLDICYSVTDALELANSFVYNSFMCFTPLAG